jgi:hypothetical protein
MTGVTATHVLRSRIARFERVLPGVCLLVLAAGCASAQPAQPVQPVQPVQPAAPSARPASSATPGSGTRALAAAYMALALPANHRLDTEVDGFTDHERDNLAAAETDLRAQAATERSFDRQLLKISFPPQIAAVARALVRANQMRIQLTDLQARSVSVTELLSFASRHKAADAAVEGQVRIIRRDLGLPPPSTS